MKSKNIPESDKEYFNNIWGKKDNIVKRDNGCFMIVVFAAIFAVAAMFIYLFVF